jgi:hypothetical protein
LGFAQEIFFGELGKCLEDGRAVGGCGADEDALWRKDAEESFEGELEEALALNDVKELLGPGGPGKGPQPRAGSACHDDAVFHCAIASLAKTCVAAWAYGRPWAALLKGGGSYPGFRLCTR